MRLTALADRYFEIIRDRDIDRLVSLYADDAVLTLPNGKKFEGIAAIIAFQMDVFERGAPYPTPVSCIAGESEIAVEVSARLPDGSVRSTANFFYTNEDGRISRLSIYGQGS